MKKFFLDNTRVAQKLTPEAAKAFFGIPDDVMDKVIESEKFVVIETLETLETERYSIQIAINTLANYQNNCYLVLLFDKFGEAITGFSTISSLELPPVWNREWGDIEYLDYLVIQKKLNNQLEKMGWSKFEIDFSTEGKSHFLIKENYQEAKEKIKRGEPYGILGLKAAARPDMVEYAKEFIKSIV